MSTKILNTLTENAYQSVSFVTSEGEDVTLVLRYIPSQETWYLDVESEKLTTRGLALVAFQDVLYSYKNNISWSLMVWSKDGFDPWRVDDFATRRIQLCVLEGLDRAITEEYLNAPSAS